MFHETLFSGWTSVFIWIIDKHEHVQGARMAVILPTRLLFTHELRFLTNKKTESRRSEWIAKSTRIIRGRVVKII